MDLDSLYVDRTGPPSRYGSSAGTRQRYGTGRAPASRYRDPAPPYSSYFAGRGHGDADTGPYGNPYRFDGRYGSEGTGDRRDSAVRRGPPPPPPPPPPEAKRPKAAKDKDKDRKRQNRKKRRSPPPSSTEEDSSTTVSSSTSEEEEESTSSGSTSRSFSSASGSTSSSSSSSDSDRSDTSTSTSTTSTSSDSALHVAKGYRSTRSSSSRAKPRRSSSAADLEAAAAAAAEAILRKEADLKRRELELLGEKQSFARDVRRRASAQRGFETEDEALAQMQRLVAIEDPTPSLHEYLRRTSATDGSSAPLLMDRSTSGSQQRSQRQSPPQSEVIGKGMNRMSAFQPTSLQASRVVVDEDPLTAPEGSRTPTLVLRERQHRSDTSATPSVADVPSSKDGPGESTKDTPPPSRSVPASGSGEDGGGSTREMDLRTRTDQKDKEKREEDEAPAADVGEGAAAAAAAAPSSVSVRPAKSGRQGSSADLSAGSPADGGGGGGDDDGIAADGPVVTIELGKKKRRVRRKSLSRSSAHEADDDTSDAGVRRAKVATLTPVRRRLNVRVRRQSRARSRSVATETDMALVEHASLPPPQEQQQHHQQRTLLSPEAPQSRFVSPQVDSEPRSTGQREHAQQQEEQLIPVDPQRYNPSVAQQQQQQQPWVATAINWPMQSPPQPAALTGAYYTAATSGPMTNKEFKNLLCTEYVPPEGTPRQQTPQQALVASRSSTSGHVAAHAAGPDNGNSSRVLSPSQRQHAQDTGQAQGQLAGSGGEEASSWEDVDSPRNVLRTGSRGGRKQQQQQQQEQRGEFEPFGMADGQPRRRVPTGGQQIDGSGLPEREDGVAGSLGDVDLVDADRYNPHGDPPPPPPTTQPGGGTIYAADQESVVEFPPPPQFTAPDMPGPGMPHGDSDGDGDCCDCCDEPCCGGGCRCCSCFSRMWHCLFPCCCRTEEEKEERRERKTRRRDRRRSKGNRQQSRQQPHDNVADAATPPIAPVQAQQQQPHVFESGGSYHQTAGPANDGGNQLARQEQPNDPPQLTPAVATPQTPQQQQQQQQNGFPPQPAAMM